MLDPPLAPFRHGYGWPVTSRHCIDIEQLGYTYRPGSLSEPSAAAASGDQRPRVITVRGINRAAINGSFLISAFATIDPVRQHVGTEAVLSRWHVEGCMNCQTPIEARAQFRVVHEPEALDADSVEVEVLTRARQLSRGPAAEAADQSRSPSSAVARVQVPAG